MIDIIESQTNGLLNKLEVFKEERLKMMETRSLIETFKKYVEEIIEHGSPYDMSRSADDLLTRARELIKTQEEFDRDKPLRDRMNFVPANIPDIISGRTRIVGQLVLRKGKRLSNVPSKLRGFAAAQLIKR